MICKQDKMMKKVDWSRRLKNVVGKYTKIRTKMRLWFVLWFVPLTLFRCYFSRAQQICPPLSIQVALFVITMFKKEALKMYLLSKR